MSTSTDQLLLRRALAGLTRGQALPAPFRTLPAEKVGILQLKAAGSGHLHFLETVSVDAGGTISLDARIVSGDGGLGVLHGTMHFAGHSVPTTGKGDGTYTASFTSTR